MLGARVKDVLSSGIVWVLLTTNTIKGQDVCPKESDGSVSWPTTNTREYARSNPLCLSDNLEVLSRCCNTDGKWANAPVCSSYQDTITNPCPDHSDWKSNFCIFIIERSAYPPQCPYEETLPFSQYITVIDSQLFPIWIPVTRDVGDYGYDLMRWMELTSNYKTPYSQCNEGNCDYYYEGTIVDKDCLIYHNSSFVEAVSCLENHTAVCAYQTLSDKLTRSFCSQIYPKTGCIQSDYSTYSKCFCRGLVNESSSATKVELLEPYQNLLYYSLNGMCYIGLEKTGSSYIWKSSNISLEYSNWAETAVFDEDYKYGAITAEGWIMLQAQNETDCVLYEKKIPRSYSSIVLDYVDDRFVLKLTNPGSWVFEEHESVPMVFCFTDASNSSLISRMNITASMVSEEQAYFYFQRHPDGPGNYWCEAFLYPSLIAKYSNKYLLRFNDSYADEYVVILNKNYHKGTNPISESSILGYQQLLAEQVLLLPDISHFHVRIFKIVNVDEDNSRVTINFHIASPSLNKSLSYYTVLGDHMRDSLTDFTFVDIVNVDYCVGVQVSSVTWPSIEINTVTRPKEGFCIGSDGLIVNRRCFGNYIDGADWLDLDEPCTIQPNTNVTVNLTNIVYLNSSTEYMEQVVEITRNNFDLLARDIELVSYFFEQISVSSHINLTAVSTIADQLMEVPKEVLKESQYWSNATDRILYQLDNVIRRTDYDGTIVGENMYIISVYAKNCNLSAIIVKEGTPLGICNVTDIDEILNIGNIDAALFLTENLTSQLLQDDMDSSRVTVSIYKNSNLFNEVGQRAKTTDLIFGITFPNAGEVQGELLTVYSVSGPEDISCSFWDYNLNKKVGHWAEAQKNYSGDSVICTYDSPKHFTLVRNEKVNITDELQTIIDSEVELTEKLNGMFSLLTDFCTNFKPIDMDLVSQLLQEAVEADENDLELITDIINVIMNIPKEVLEESQKTYNTSKRIIYYFDQILHNFSSSQVLRMSNIYVVIQYLKEERFYGFTIDGSDGKYNFNLLKEEATVDEISQTQNLDTALLISSTMVDQLLQYEEQDYVPKVVTVVFFKDSLFVKDDEHPIKTKVVGVAFPKFEAAPNGDITLLYDLGGNVSLYYTCSVYQSDIDESTIVKGFWNSESISLLTNEFHVCKFWKNTYFSIIYSLFNLTERLESTLQKDKDVVVMLENTIAITETYYEYLEPDDVFLIAQILAAVQETSEFILELYLIIVNDIMKVSRSVLQTSQEISNSTELILYNLYNVVKTLDGTRGIYKENLLVLVSLLDTGMYGIRLENCLQRCNPYILYNNTAVQKTPLDKSDVELTLSSNLIDSLLNAKSEGYNPKIALIIFYNDALFVEKCVSRDTSQVFGIYFPDYNENLSGEIRLSLELSAANASDYNCVSWTTTDSERLWLYESRPRSSEPLTCNFFEQNYFTIAKEETATQNVTLVLNSILNSKTSFLPKLYRAEDISHYYTDFVAYDIYQFSVILMLCDTLSDDGLDMVSVIINNILLAPQDTLLESMRQWDALRQILQSINHVSMFANSRQYSLLKDQFGLVVCQLNSNSANGVILTAYDIKCTYEVSDDSFAHSENIVASLILSKEVVAQAVEEDNTKVVVSVFSNNVFFNMEEVVTSTLVLGLSIPNLPEELAGDVEVLYNNTLYNGTNCGFWKNRNKWSVRNGETSASFIKCKYSEVTYFTVKEYSNNNDPVNITQILEDIIDSNRSQSEKLTLALVVLSDYSEQFEAYNVDQISTILSGVEQADASSLETVANIVNKMMNLPRQVLADSQEAYHATDWILHHIDRITETVPCPVKFETENFVVISWCNMSGIYVENCNGNCNVEILIDGNFTTMCDNVNTAFVFDDDLQKEMLKNVSQQIVITVHFNNALFNEGYSYKNVGPIVGIVIPSQKDELNGSFLFYYYTKVYSTKACAYWNYAVVGEELRKGSWKLNRPLIQPSEVAMCQGMHATHFALLQVQQNLTSDLEDIINSDSTAAEKLEELVSVVSDAGVRFRPVDIYLISKILEYALDEVDVSKMNMTSAIVSSLFHVPREVLRESQVTYYATDKILHTVEQMAKGLSFLDSDIDPIVQHNFTIAFYDLKETNISGLLLENCSDSQCSISVLEGTVNLTELVMIERLQTAIALSDELQEQIRRGKQSAKLAVTIYFSDVLFNEQSERDGKVSMVCGVMLPGFHDDFLGNLYVMFNTKDKVDYTNNSCAFWNFKVENGVEIVEGSWKSEKDPHAKDHFKICPFDHVTHFALLLARDDSNFADANKYKILDIITAVNSILSIIGIFGILLTAALFERWRRNTGNQILVHFSIAMSIKMIMLYVSAGVFSEDMREVVCFVTGAILHYAILSEFCWMLIIAILQFKRFVEVLGGPPKFVLLKACICGWVFPILPVLLILLIDKQNYSEGSAGLCYPSGLGLYLGIWLPIVVIVSINFVIFIFIIYNVFHKKTESRDMVNHEILFQWRLALLLFSMLGLTWLFGFMSQIPGAESIFVYLFTFSATLQGFIMFLFFIVFNKSTRFLYSQSIKMWLYAKGYKMH